MLSVVPLMEGPSCLNQKVIDVDDLIEAHRMDGENRRSDLCLWRCRHRSISSLTKLITFTATVLDVQRERDSGTLSC